MEAIKEYLKSKGFIEDPENVFVYLQKQVKQIIINNQPITQEFENKLIIKYLGDGSINDTEHLYGFSIYQNDTHVIDEWVSNIEQFKKII